ncbi:MAG: ATP-binding protein [Bacillota bacterium]
MEELSQHILDVALNSLKAGATRLEIFVREDIPANVLEFRVRDNGHGMAKEYIEKMQDPFFTTKKNKRVGLGIPLLKEAVERCGGIFKIRTSPTVGATVTAKFPYDHLDRAPLGDIAGTLSVLITSSQSIQIIYRHYYNDKAFFLDTGELESTLGGIPLHTPEVLVWLKDYLNRNIAVLKEAGKIEKLGRTG